MNTTQLLEAERIAEQLFVVHIGLVKSGQEGIDPNTRLARKLARAINIFKADAEAIVSTDSRRTMDRLLEEL